MTYIPPLVSTPSPGVMLPLPQLLLLLRCWGCHRELLASIVPHQEGFHVHTDSFFLLILGSIWVHFYLLLTYFYIFALSELV